MISNSIAPTSLTRFFILYHIMCLTLGSQCGKPKGTSDSTPRQYADSADSQPDICFEGPFAVEHASSGFAYHI